MPTEAILTAARQFLDVDPTVRITLTPIKRGASGRTIVRVKAPTHEPFIGVHWTEEREDNAQFVPIARFLKSAKFRVPEILFEKSRYRVALVEDLGDVDLLSTKAQSFAERMPFYQSAFEQLDRLFYAKVPKDLPLMPPFDAGLYRWEQQYFFDYLVEDFLGMNADSLQNDPAFSNLAERLGTVAKNLVHRDFQSQNMLIKNGQVYWIDFQGMRRGRQEYDLASLIFDPYLNHSAEERAALLDLWEEMTDERPVTSLFHECAAQRLMQALGAFGNIVKNRGDDWYRQHIPVAAELLGVVTAGTPLERGLAPVLDRLVGSTP
ncbi:MAG: hypothetical protein EAZ42_11780 [Verrucomicrobia bacterium]|nr:MAG: hypothetical protein EAZ42_11780 [Verrucomicrobiota bacterium]